MKRGGKYYPKGTLINGILGLLSMAFEIFIEMILDIIASITKGKMHS